MISIVLFILAFISLVVAAVAIGWLSIVSKHLSALGKRVLESEDLGRVIQAADKISSFESRMADCEKNADQNKNQLAEHESTINEIASKLREVEQMIKKHAVDLANTSEKMVSFEHCFNDFENNIGDKLNKLLEYETKVNELVAKLESVEQIANKNESGLAEADRNIKARKDEIETLRKFQAATEKTHSLIQAAFSDMQASTLPEESPGITSEAAKLEETSQQPEDMPQELEDQKASGRYDLEL
jgi:chromosome segregation ATPase